MIKVINYLRVMPNQYLPNMECRIVKFVRRVSELL